MADKKTPSLFDFMDYDYQKDKEVTKSKSLSSNPVEAKGNESKKEIDDFGEKIGGARKDYYNYSPKEVKNLNEVEALKVLKKSNFWASPKYEDLHEKGYSADTSVYIRAIYLGTTASLSKAHANDKAAQLKYFEFVNDIKDIVNNIPTDKTPNMASTFLMKQLANKDYLEKIGDNRYKALTKYHDLYSLGYIKRTFMQRVTYKLDVKLRAEIKNASWDKLLVKDNKIINRNSIRKQINDIEYLDKYVRSGENATDYRQGKDVTVEEFWNKFQLRAGEFGNYLSQKERQKILNYTYDAFIDMSKVLNLPPEAIGLNGKLAIAFGARGTGGIGAASAHYEPSKVVINLTKFKGAGSLAHEWLHALDNYIDNRSKNKDVGAEFASMLSAQKPEYNGDYTPYAKTNMLIKATSTLLKYSELDLLDAVEKNKYSDIDNGYSKIGQLKNIENDAKNKRKNKDYYISKFERAVSDLGKTDFYQSALNLDDNRKRAYFSTDIEMTARAFEAFLYAEMASNGIRNDFLVNPKKNEPTLWNNLGLDYPYPQDQERELFAKGFKKVFEYISQNKLLDREISKNQDASVEKNIETKNLKEIKKSSDRPSPM